MSMTGHGCVTAHHKAGCRPAAMRLRRMIAASTGRVGHGRARLASLSDEHAPQTTQETARVALRSATPYRRCPGVEALAAPRPMSVLPSHGHPTSAAPPAPRAGRPTAIRRGAPRGHTWPRCTHGCPPRRRKRGLSANGKRCNSPTRSLAAGLDGRPRAKAWHTADRWLTTSPWVACRPGPRAARAAAFVAKESAHELPAEALCLNGSGVHIDLPKGPELGDRRNRVPVSNVAPHAAERAAVARGEHPASTKGVDDGRAIGHHVSGAIGQGQQRWRPRGAHQQPQLAGSTGALVRKRPASATHRHRLAPPPRPQSRRAASPHE